MLLGAKSFYTRDLTHNAVYCGVTLMKMLSLRRADTMANVQGTCTDTVGRCYSTALAGQSVNTAPHSAQLCAECTHVSHEIIDNPEV